MPKLPVLSGAEVLKALQKAGFAAMRQKGSHIFLRKEISSDNKAVTVIPLHKEVDKGTLLEIIRQSKLTKEEFLKLLR